MTTPPAEHNRAGAATRLLRRVLGSIAILLLGGALAWAPVAAFHGGMLAVAKAALAGLAFLIVMKLLPQHDAEPEHRPEAVDGRD